MLSMFGLTAQGQLLELTGAVLAGEVEGALRDLFLQMKQWAAAQTAGSLAWRILIVSLIPLVVLLRGIVAYLSSYLMGWVAVRTICDLRARLFEHANDAAAADSKPAKTSATAKPRFISPSLTP